MNNIYIYNKETLNILAEPFIISLEDFKREPTKFFPTWNNQEMIISETKLDYPIFIDGILREKTREEKIILDNKEELLEVGEFTRNNQIIKVKYNDNLNYYKKTWDKINHIWIEGIKKDELIEIRKEKILNYEKLKSDKLILENSEFSTIKEIEILNLELENLATNINKIALKIKGI